MYQVSLHFYHIFGPFQNYLVQSKLNSESFLVNTNYLEQFVMFYCSSLIFNFHKLNQFTTLVYEEKMSKKLSLEGKQAKYVSFKRGITKLICLPMHTKNIHLHFCVAKSVWDQSKLGKGCYFYFRDQGFSRMFSFSY